MKNSRLLEKISGNAGINLPLDQLLEHLNSDDPKIRRDAIIAIEKRGDKKAAEHLGQMLEDNDEFVRVYAAQAIGKLGDRMVIGKLKEAKGSVQPDVQFYFDEALAKISKKPVEKPPDNSVDIYHCCPEVDL